MKLLRILFFVIGFIAFGNVHAIDLAANISYARFKNANTPYIEVYVSVDGSTVNFVQNKNKKYQASVLCELKLTDVAGEKYADKFLFLSPEFDSVRTFDRFDFQKRIVIQNADHILNISLDDVNTPDTAVTAMLPIPVKFIADSIQTSDIQFLASYEKSDEQNDFTKNGYALITHNSSFFNAAQTSMKFYFEIYNTDRTTDDEFLLQYFVVDALTAKKNNDVGSFKKLKTGKQIAQLIEMDIANLPSGNYYLIAQGKDKRGKEIFFEKKYFEKSNPNLIRSAQKGFDVNNTFVSNLTVGQMKHYISAFRPLGSEMEQNTIAAIENSEDTAMIKNFFYSFCEKRNPNSTEFYWTKLKESIDYTDKNFSAYKQRGYECELGRVYLKYGAPNRIETEFDDPQRDATKTSFPYQIWYYYKAGNQMNRVFVFVKRSIAGKCYDLIHSDVIGEKYIPDWMNHRNWKELLRNYNGANQSLEYSRDDYYNK